MKKFKIGILGSCVSRDAFEFDNGKYDLKGSYFARSSIASMMSSPVEFEQSDIKVENQWLRWVLVNDFQKTVVQQLKTKNLDCLIIDLIDERFDLLKIDDGFLNGSDELFKACKEFIENHGSVTCIKRDSPQAHELFAEAAREFANRLNEEFADLPIIIHKALCSTNYTDGKEIYKFSEESTALYENMNSYLSFYYSILEKEINNVSVIHLPQEVQLASKSHRWGLAPFHYVDDYYRAFLRELDALNQFKVASDKTQHKNDGI